MPETDSPKIIACPKCAAGFEEAAIREALNTCPACGHHYRMEPMERLDYLVDPGSFVEFAQGLQSRNPVGFPEYEDKLAESKARSRLSEAIVTGRCTIEGKPVILGLMSFLFMGGSMGSVVGEKINRALLKGVDEQLPVIIYTASGGARMQEGIFSLMQMAKTASAVAELDKAGLPFFIVLCDPTTGGVTASFAMLADITLAEPNALIGFAGRRVIENTIRQQLPDDFQLAEFQLAHGFVDIIVPRQNQRHILAALIDLHSHNGSPRKVQE